MKIRILFRVVALVAGVMEAGAALGAADLSQWTRVALVQVPVKPEKGLVEAALTPAVLAAARPDRADLRLTNAAGEIMPYVLRTEQGEAGRTETYPARLFNATYLPRQQSTVTADLGGRARRTRVDVDTPGTNFRRRVRVEASQDGVAWGVLCQTAWLFRIDYGTGTHSKNEIALPDNDFRYLRITVFNGPDDPEQVAIRSVAAFYEKSAAPKTVEVPTQSVQVTGNDKLKATEIEVDLGYENLPLWEVALACDDANFLRRVEVLGRNVKMRVISEAVEDAPPRKREVEEPWGFAMGGTVYRLPAGPGQESVADLRLTVTAPCRYLLVRVYNGDDVALKLRGVKVYRRQEFVGFRAEAAGAYKLYVGNAVAERPQYDLEHFAPRLRGEGVTEAALGAVAANPAFAWVPKTAPWSERHAWALWALLLAVGAVLGVVLWRQARQARRAN